MNTDPPSIIVVGGPTGVGKTAFSLALAEELNAEIVSIDSVQIYRGLDIGSAKASAAERERVPHHLIDVFDPDEPCNVADFMNLAHESIQGILGRGKNVIATGGTNLYVRVLVHGLFEAPPADESIRNRHRESAAEHGVPHLHAALKEVDPDLALRVHENDLIRVSRGLEVFEQTGNKLSALQDAHQFRTPNYRAFKLMFNRPRPELYERINSRVDQMMEAGFLDEYRGLIKDFAPDLKPLQSLGYRHMGMHVNAELPLEETIELLKRDTRRFAKQQVSWLRSERNVRWALAPMIHGDTIPPLVVDDLRRFIAGEDFDPSWTSRDSNQLQDPPNV